MILAGIDEAGYGPLLGPLVVGCCAMELVDVAADEEGWPPPCVWKRLGKVVSRKRSANGRRLHVNDSKLVYNPSTGLRELERSVLAFAALLPRGWPASLDDLLACLAAHALDDLAAHAWYAADEGEAFPLSQDALAVRVMANALGRELARTQTRLAHLAARVVCEGRYNRMVEATRNKSSVLFSTAAIHLDHLLRTFGERGLTIVCDRQGGREHYGPLLRLMFDEWSLEVLDERDGRSDYKLHRRGHVVRLTFREKAEAQCLPVAAASMLCKYLREALMARFNAYWKQHVPALRETAGYYTDGVRFLEDIAAARATLGVEDARLVRSR